MPSRTTKPTASKLAVDRATKPPNKLEVRIDLAAATAAKATLRVTYAVRQARWAPLYDARLDTGITIGEVSALLNFGAGDLLEVRDPRSGDTFLYPFTKAVVPTIRIAEGFLIISPPLDADPGEEEPG